MRNQKVAGTELEEGPGHRLQLHPRVVADLLSGREELRDPSFLGPRRCLFLDQRLGGSSNSVVRSCQAVARINSPASPDSEASTIRTFRPGRSTRVSTVTGPIGTGRKISNTIRPTWKSSEPSIPSISRPSNADGGPAC